MGTVIRDLPPGTVVTLGGDRFPGFVLVVLALVAVPFVSYGLTLAAAAAISRLRGL